MEDDLDAAAGHVDESDELDLVPVFTSAGVDAEMEAMAIHTLLQANRIPSVLVGASQLPSLDFQLQVPRARLEQAEQVITEARAAGPAAAAEAESLSEDAI